MDPDLLAVRMAGIIPDMNVVSGWTARYQRFDGVPHGKAVVSFSPETRGGGVESVNHNRIHLLGGGGLTGEGFAELCGLLRDDGADPFFVGLAPGPERDHARALIVEAGFELNRWTRYPTMALTGPAEVMPQSDLLIEEVGPEDVASASLALGPDLWPSYLRSAGKPGFHHYLAFDGERPVAHAALYVAGGIGYLGWMSTAEADRRRGAQQALIVARIEKARALGVDIIISETLTNLKSSLGNLHRAGFREVYDVEVYRSPDP